MPKNQNAGLDIKSAWDEANAEALSEEAAVEPDNSTLESPPADNVEQLAVESNEKSRLFSDLVDEPISNEQPVTDSYEVTVNGEKSMVSLEELRSGYMRQAAHTQAMQELSNEKKELADAATLYQAYKANPVAVAQKLWEAARQGRTDSPIVEKQATTPGREMNIEDEIAQRVQEALNAHPLLQQIQGQQALDEVMATFDQIEKDYGETLTLEDRRDVMLEAQKQNTDDVEAIFAKMYFKVQNKQRALQNVERNSTATGYPGEAAMGITPTAPREAPRFSSFRDALNETLVEENIGKDALDRVVSNL